jgi:hypothetical protein
MKRPFAFACLPFVALLGLAPAAPARAEVTAWVP